MFCKWLPLKAVPCSSLVLQPCAGKWPACRRSGAKLPPEESLPWVRHCIAVDVGGERVIVDLVPGTSPAGVANLFIWCTAYLEDAGEMFVPISTHFTDSCQQRFVSQLLLLLTRTSIQGPIKATL